jgi:hypothetical protein
LAEIKKGEGEEAYGANRNRYGGAGALALNGTKWSEGRLTRCELKACPLNTYERLKAILHKLWFDKEV